MRFTTRREPEAVDDGVIRLDGEDVTDPRVDPDTVRRRVGIAFQAFNLFPHKAVLDNVTPAPRQVHKRPRRQAEDEARSGRAADPAVLAPNRRGRPSLAGSRW